MNDVFKRQTEYFKELSDVYIDSIDAIIKSPDAK